MRDEKTENEEKAEIEREFGSETEKQRDRERGSPPAASSSAAAVAAAGESSAAAAAAAPAAGLQHQQERFQRCGSEAHWLSCSRALLEASADSASQASELSAAADPTSAVGANYQPPSSPATQRRSSSTAEPPPPHEPRRKRWKQQPEGGGSVVAASAVPDGARCGGIADLRLHAIPPDLNLGFRIGSQAIHGFPQVEQSRSASASTAAESPTTASSAAAQRFSGVDSIITVPDADIATAFRVHTITSIAVPFTFPKSAVFAIDDRSIRVSTVPNLSKTTRAEP
ncbi:hypothetical protein LOK49_LG08G01024 [Camellia lanceoleosa]|uniref:Uncharacterized protein n=1 Tax=Camellia lanceoleosa TaxID=1840588 RepID=A0ACC0GUX7_9ERIC|nr:hypothetical protein LOK49_LG08G01024 [Camellia lanceoleosa]